MVNLSFVNPKNSLKNSAHKSSIVKAICERVEEFENHHSLRTDSELLKFVCNLVENSPELEKHKIDRESLVIDVYVKLFNVSENEKKVLIRDMSFLNDNNLIVKTNVIRKWFRKFVDYISKKF